MKPLVFAHSAGSILWGRHPMGIVEAEQVRVILVSEGRLALADGDWRAFRGSRVLLAQLHDAMNAAMNWRRCSSPEWAGVLDAEIKGGV